MPRRNSRDPETDPAANFGETLKRLREAAKITTQGGAGKRQQYSHQTISRWETGASVPDEAQLNGLLDEYGVTGLLRDIVVGSWRLAVRVKGPIPEFIQKYFEAQEKATFLRFWALILVPGMLQVKEYAQAMYDLPGMDSEKAAETVAIRMERQSIIEGPDAPQVIAVLHEAVLYTPHRIACGHGQADRPLAGTVGTAQRNDPDHQGQGCVLGTLRSRSRSRAAPRSPTRC